MGIAVQAQDAVYGRGAADLHVRLDHDDDGQWVLEAETRTDQDGSVSEWADRPLDRGLYRIVFATDPYFVGLGLGAAYPEIVVTFRMVDETAVNNIVVLLSPHFSSVYFGSLG
jgi:5-hydroxyisourate hydrolase